MPLASLLSFFRRRWKKSVFSPFVSYFYYRKVFGWSQCGRLTVKPAKYFLLSIHSSYYVRNQEQLLLRTWVVSGNLEAKLHTCLILCPAEKHRRWNHMISSMPFVKLTPIASFFHQTLLLFLFICERSVKYWKNMFWNKNSNLSVYKRLFGVKNSFHWQCRLCSKQGTREQETRQHQFSLRE